MTRKRPAETERYAPYGAAAIRTTGVHSPSIFFFSVAALASFILLIVSGVVLAAFGRGGDFSWGHFLQRALPGGPGVSSFFSWCWCTSGQRSFRSVARRRGTRSWRSN